MGKYCVDYIKEIPSWCWCDGDRLVCVPLPDDDALWKCRRDGVPWCTKDFCKTKGDE